MRWGAAMAAALYGPGGFFTGSGPGPAGHFRTSVHASMVPARSMRHARDPAPSPPLFAGALWRLVAAVDEALGRPSQLDLVDVGAGRGELLRALVSLAPAEVAARLRPVGVELAPRPADLPAGIGWAAVPPSAVTGVLLATEWLDNVPLDVVEADPAGVPRYVEVDEAGHEFLGEPVSGEDARWLDRWWPLAGPAARAEVGAARDRAWAETVARVERGLALAVDYGHLLRDRPAGGTLTGFRAGRQVPPVPDGSCDLTAHVAMDAVAASAGVPYVLVSQRTALRALGVDAARPPLALATSDPAGYVRALAAASAAAELTDPAGLGAHWWLLHPVGVEAALPDFDVAR